MKTKIKIIVGLSAFLIFTASNLLGLQHSLSDDSPKEKKMGWIGVVVQDVDKKIARKAKLESTDGAYLKEVLDDSPADSAGLMEGDVIVEFNSKKVYDADDLSKAVRKTQPGTKVIVNIVRDGEKKQINLTVGKRKEIRHSKFNIIPGIMDIRAFTGNDMFGLRLITLNEQLGEYFGAPNNEGVLVEEVRKESIGEKAGFKAGDIIVRIGKKTIGDVEKIKREILKYNDGDKVEIEVLRKNSKKILIIEIEEESLPSNFFFHKPDFRMFRGGAFDYEDLQMELDEIRPEIGKMKINIKQFKDDLI